MAPVTIDVKTLEHPVSMSLCCASAAAARKFLAWQNWQTSTCTLRTSLVRSDLRKDRLCGLHD
jgi:hypothetical protein